VPTPFYHLSIAQDLIAHPELSPAVRSLLREQVGPFLLGNTAPDVQVISGQSRWATHFFSIPIKSGAQVPWDRLLGEYPGLIHSIDSQPAKAAFIAGYLCHLQADWLWVLDIFLPVFGPYQSWEDFSTRLYLHNVLRSYLDQVVVQSLSSGVIIDLQPTQTSRWLPFVKDVHLNQWRDYLVYQLQPGRQVQTVEVFAARHGIDAREFYKLTQSEARMEEQVFSRLPRQQLGDYRRQLVAQNVNLLQDYLNRTLPPGAHPGDGSADYTSNFDRSSQ
jgi:hypothetical protein